VGRVLAAYAEAADRAGVPWPWADGGPPG